MRTVHVLGRFRSPRWLGLGAAVLIATLIAVVLGTGIGRDPSVVRSALISKAAPPLAGPDINGSIVDIRNYRGKVVLVNVWASWCAACRQEHPVLVAAQQQLGPRGVQLLGIDMKDTTAGARRFLREMGQTWPSVADPNARHAVEWGTFAVPETYVVSPTGVILDKATGAVTAEWIQRHVVARLAS